MNFFKSLAMVGLVSLASVYADSPSPKLPDKEKLIQYSESMDELLQNFECSFTKRLKLLPEWYELHSGDPVIRNKDGYNDIVEVLYRRNDPKWFFRISNITDDDNSQHYQYGRHFDGTIFWDNNEHPHSRKIVIYNQLPNVPIFIERLLSRFPSDNDGYCRVSQSEIPIEKVPSLKSILNNPENEIRILPINDKSFKVMAIQLNLKHPFKGMNRLKEFYFETNQQKLRLVKYHPTAMYINNGEEYIFHPLMEVTFSDFKKVSGSHIDVPMNIQTVFLSEETKKYTNQISTADDLINLDKAGWKVPIQEETVAFSSFNKEFSFEKGDIAFNYDAGTEYWDQRDKKKHRVGETNAPSKSP